MEDDPKQKAKRYCNCDYWKCNIDKIVSKQNYTKDFFCFCPWCGKELCYDHVFLEKNKWYFWDVLWINKHGPFKNEKNARKSQKKYIAELMA